MIWPDFALRHPEPATPTLSQPPEATDVAIIGAGVIGLSIGWSLARQGLRVALFDRNSAGTGASAAATGMLAAAAEFEPGGEDLLELALQSQRLWPDFRDRLEAESGLSIDYRAEGTLVLALSRDEVERLRHRHAMQTRFDLDVAWLSGPEARGREPGLHPSTAAALFCPQDHQVDPRRVLAALIRAFTAAGGTLCQGLAVNSLSLNGGRVEGVVTPRGSCRAKCVILANGAWSGSSTFLPFPPPVRPLRGQSLALRTTATAPGLTHVVWSETVHLSPKGDGRLVIGATMEECGFSQAVTAGGALALLDGARRVLPAIEDMPVEALWCGFRPSSDDDAPILGESGTSGLILATGHHRNGYLLAPATAEAIATLVITGELTEPARKFGLNRFGAPHDDEVRHAAAR